MAWWGTTEQRQKVSQAEQTTRSRWQETTLKGLCLDHTLHVDRAWLKVNLDRRTWTEGHRLDHGSL